MILARTTAKHGKNAISNGRWMDAIQFARAITAFRQHFFGVSSHICSIYQTLSLKTTHFLMNVFRTAVLCIYLVAILLFHLVSCRSIIRLSTNGYPKFGVWVYVICEYETQIASLFRMLRKFVEIRIYSMFDECFGKFFHRTHSHRVRRKRVNGVYSLCINLHTQLKLCNVQSIEFSLEKSHLAVKIVNMNLSAAHLKWSVSYPLIRS